MPSPTTLYVLYVMTGASVSHSGGSLNALSGLQPYCLLEVPGCILMRKVLG